MPRKAYTDQERANDYKTVFGTPTGQKVLSDILSRSHVFTGIKALKSEDRMIAEGMRQCALLIANFVRWDANKFVDQWKQTEEIFPDD